MKSHNQSDTPITVLMSGGLDSSALAAFCLANGYQIGGIFIDHGQVASKHEWRSAQSIASQLSIPIKRIECPGLTFGAGELIGRNLFLVSAAIFLGHAHRGLIAIGVHAGTPYYDCSRNFVDRLNSLIEEQSSGTISIFAPFLDWQKPQILKYFLDTRLPLASTYSCESGTMPPCGSCASCRDREALGC